MFFFGTYAIFEIINGNKNYEKYRSFNFIVSILNIAEFYAGLLKDNGMIEADKVYANFTFDILEIPENVMIEAVKFKHKYKKQDISLPDSVGYLLAKKYKLRFLTGDKEFEGFDNVEFIK